MDFCAIVDTTTRQDLQEENQESISGDTKLPTGSFTSLVSLKKNPIQPNNKKPSFAPQKYQLSNKLFTKPVEIMLLALVSPFDTLQNWHFLFIATHHRQVSEITNVYLLAYTFIPQS